jgi:hypothetical protein
MAQQDLRNLSHIIAFQHHSPITALRYIKGVYNEFKWLESNAETLKIQTRKSFHQYGFNVRCINYKKMTIIYVISSNTVYIQSIIPSNTVTE